VTRYDQAAVGTKVLLACRLVDLRRGFDRLPLPPAPLVAPPGSLTMKRITIAAAVAGILLGTALVGYFGFAEVGRALFEVGWAGFLAILAYHLAGMAFLGFCWYVLAPRSAPLSAFIWGRLIRASAKASRFRRSMRSRMARCSCRFTR